VYDLVIRNGYIVDGTGLPRYRADLAIQSGRIACIGRIKDSAKQVIDAEGHVITPGFIDGHTHMDAQVFWDPLGSQSCWHGVTSVVMGNCGFTLAPCNPDERQLVVRNLERAEDISGVAMAAGIDWTWSTFSEYLRAVESQPKAINYAANIGHSALRTWAMGERAFEEEATADDLELMAEELRSALRAGAVGLTTSRSSSHTTSDGRPVASRLAAWDEVTSLVSVVAEFSHGLFELANGDGIRSADRAAREAAATELRSLALGTGVPVMFGVLPSLRGEAVDETLLELIDTVCASGGRMVGQSHSRGISLISSFKTTMPYDLLAEWGSFRALPLTKQLEELRRPEVRSTLSAAARHGSYRPSVGAEPRRPDYDTMQVMMSPLPPNPTVAQLASERGIDPVELVLDLALESEFGVLFLQPDTSYDSGRLLRIMRHPHTVMTFSDSGAHVSQIMDASIQTHLLAYWVRGRQEFSLEEGVRMVTLEPARVWGFHERGLLREGLVADINVFDPETISPLLPEVKADLPGGAKHLEQRASGFLATVVGGVPVILEGSSTNRFPGQLVRMGQSSG
jgi:N-acyl-D-amino-acid deacylase